MPQIIEVPGFGQVEFPDNMNDEQITAAIQRNMIPREEESHPLSGNYVSNKPSAAKTLIKRMIPLADTTEMAVNYGPAALRKTGEILGLDDAGETIGKAAAYYTRPEGLSAEAAKEAGLQPTTGEMVGSGLQVGSLLLPYGRIAKGATSVATATGLSPKVASLIGTGVSGATGGYTYEAGDKIAKGEAPTPGVQTFLGAAIPPAIQGATMALRSKPVDAALNATIKNGINKGIRPSIGEAGKTAAQNAAYYKKAQKAVESIVDNKASLEFMDDAGHIVKNRLPENLNEFSQAIDQTKRGVFQKYDTLAKAAGQEGANINLVSIADELKSITNNKVLSDMNPSVVAYANERMATLAKRGSYSVLEAQEAVTTLNNSLNAFYKNPTYDTASKAYVDSLIANKMRQSLDDVIEGATAGGYQELKNTYGALKAIEKDVSRRAIVDARKNIKGLVDFSDIYSGTQAVHGLLTLSPSAMASAATAKGISTYLKRMNDPNRIVSKMFSQSEKLMGQPPKPPMNLPRTPGDIIADEVPSRLKSFIKAFSKSKSPNKVQVIAEAHVKHGFKPLPAGEIAPQPMALGTGQVSNPKALSAGELQQLYGPDGQFIMDIRPKTMNRPASRNVDTKYYKKIKDAVLIYDPKKESYYMLPDNISGINKRGGNLLELAQQSQVPQHEIIDISPTSKLLDAAQKNQIKAKWPNK